MAEALIPPGLVLAMGWAGVAVFALTGALVAARKNMDPFGFALLATVTGLGGGTLRDLLLGADPIFWVVDPTDVLICVAVSLATFLFGSRAGWLTRREQAGSVLLWADAMGLALFAALGAQKALAAGAHPFSAVALGAITATFGGIIRDLLAGETPLVLHREIYVTAAAAGAATVVLARAGGLDVSLEMLLGFAVAFGLRGAAILYGWSLPQYGKLR